MKWLVGLALLAALAFLLYLGLRPQKATLVELRVDTTLATVPAWQDSARAKDSIIAVRDRRHRKEVAARLAESARADTAEAKADSLQAWADTLALIPEGTASDSVLHLGSALVAQKRAAVQFRLSIDSLNAYRVRDSLRILEANGTIADMKQWRTQDSTRIDRLTVDLDDLRTETKHKGEWNLPFGIHLPGWTKDVAKIGGAGYVGYRIGRAVAQD